MLIKIVPQKLITINPDRVSARFNYQKTEAGKIFGNRAKREWNEANQIKRAVNTIVGNAVRNGKLIRPTVCSECFKVAQRIHGHHDDYAYPLTVRWLCARCHCAWHKANGSAVNG